MHSETAINKMALHNTVIFAIAQAFMGAVSPLIMAVSALQGYELLGADKALATLPVSVYMIGPIIGSMPAALLMRSTGRRLGFQVGSVVLMAGCGLAAYTILLNHFIGFVLAHLLIGIGFAFVNQFRFAAADIGTPKMRIRAVSWVLVGGVFAAIIGPQTALHTRTLFDPLVFAGAYVGGAGLAIVGFFILTFLKSPPVAPVEEVNKTPRPLLQIVRQPRFLTAIVCAMVSFSLMSLMMTATPIAMILCGHSSSDATLGIQWHVIAMFAPSFFTGNLINRFGHMAIIGSGMVMFLICAALGLSGIEIWNFVTVLIILGIAWNFGYVGASSLVTTTYEPHEKNKVQGIFDTIVFTLVAAASFLSGALMAIEGGWDMIMMASFVPVGLCIVVLFWFHKQRDQDSVGAHG